MIPINPIPAAEIQDYDRIGFVIASFSYYFNPNDVPENAYRYVDLALNPLAGDHLDTDTDIVRGDVITKIWKNGCPASFANSASAFFPQMVLEKGESLPMGTTCSIGESTHLCRFWSFLYSQYQLQSSVYNRSRLFFKSSIGSRSILQCGPKTQV